MDDMNDSLPVPPGWIEALERSEAQFAAGDTVSSASVRQLIRASIARLETERVDAPNPEATRGH